MRKPKLLKKEELSTLSLKNFSSLDLSQQQLSYEDLLHTAKILTDRININSKNSSMPPSSDFFDKDQEDSNTNTDTQHEQDNNATKNKQSKQHNRADARKPRNQGFGRTQKLPINEVINLKPNCCSGCKASFDDSAISKAFGGYYQIDLIKESLGYHVINNLYITHQTYCPACDVWTKYQPNQYVSKDGYIIKDNGLVGSTLASVLSVLNKRYRLPVGHIKSLISDLWSLEVGAGTINQAIISSALCCEPLVDEIAKEVIKSDLCHMDETGWYIHHKSTWLWACVTVSACLFMIGSRTKEMAQMMLTDRFNGWLMSDGYAAYRHYDKRFRCLAHLYRKARSLSQSTDRENKRFGDLTMNLIQSIMSRIKQARINNEFSIISDFRYRLFIFKAHCLKYRKSQSAKAQALAKEFLNDWDAIF
ncbi:MULTISPECIES: IS66 family transposase, partial [Cysteiniphilum]|uniref:IS66 family transposase n=1 Tax=Cysteiniphilum TaxID=2056696 RepID=UPI001782F033